MPGGGWPRQFSSPGPVEHHRLVPTAVAAIIILCYDGAAGMLAAYGSIAALGGSLYMLIRVGRSYRDVMPPEPKARRAKE